MDPTVKVKEFLLASGLGERCISTRARHADPRESGEGTRDNFHTTVATGPADAIAIRALRRRPDPSRVPIAWSRTRVLVLGGGRTDGLEEAL
jgi:hypothetical protein